MALQGLLDEGAGDRNGGDFLAEVRDMHAIVVLGGTVDVIQRDNGSASWYCRYHWIGDNGVIVALWVLLDK